MRSTEESPLRACTWRAASRNPQGNVSAVPPHRGALLSETQRPRNKGNRAHGKRVNKAEPTRGKRKAGLAWLCSNNSPVSRWLSRQSKEKMGGPILLRQVDVGLAVQQQLCGFAVAYLTWGTRGIRRGRREQRTSRYATRARAERKGWCVPHRRTYRHHGRSATGARVFVGTARCNGS
jgi:hypothetical protein